MSRIGLLLSLALTGALLPTAATADTDTDTSIMLRALASAWDYPDPLPGSEDDYGAGLAARLITETRSSQGLKLELNLFQTWLDKDIAGSDFDALLLAPERSGALETNLSNEDYAHLGADTLRLAWNHDALDLSLGRQPINLATTFYFSANDVFAPFAAQDFYRLYKAGVDSLRGDLALSELSSLHLYLVSGFTPDPDSDTGWSRQMDSSRHSALLHYNTVVQDTDLAAVAGSLRGEDFLATGLQGEVGEWLGIRLEAQWRQSTLDSDRWLLSHTLGLEHRFENSLDLRLELFRNGRGASRTDDYLQVILDSTRYPGEPFYLARHYLAFGASYELSPLWIAHGLIMHNRIDDSSFTSLSASRSLSNEADLVFGVNLPWGKRSRAGIPQSEFGSGARTVTLEVRQYF